MASEPEPSATRRAFELAVTAISRRERTVAELREWLAAREIEPDELELTIARLAELGELDDEAFAKAYAEDKRELRGWGPHRIREALLDRGIEAELASAAVGESSEEQVERAAAILAGRGVDAGEERGRAKALAFLARRGYDSEVAYAAMRRIERDAA